jgi:hypothetical protein
MDTQTSRRLTDTACGTCELNTVTLRDIYDAVGSPTVFAVCNRTETPECLVEQTVNGALDDAFRPH